MWLLGVTVVTLIVEVVAAFARGATEEPNDAAYIVGYALAGPVRGATFPVLMVILMFGMFQLRPRTVQIVAVYALVIYGSVMAFSQDNARLVVGYSSIAQIGFVLLGFGLAVSGERGAQRAGLGYPREGSCRCSGCAVWHRCGECQGCRFGRARSLTNSNCASPSDSESVGWGAFLLAE